jgi:lysozyme family protein
MNEPYCDPHKIFNVAVGLTMSAEGGYVWDKNDPGGETKYGISQRAYPLLDIENLDPGMARQIYFRDYWRQPRFDALAAIAPDLAIKCFDLGVNCGPATAIKFLQRGVNTVCAGHIDPLRQSAWQQKIVRILNGNVLKVDGYIGPITLNVISACPHDAALMAALKGEAYAHYKKLDPANAAGWLNRLEA